MYRLGRFDCGKEPEATKATPGDKLQEACETFTEISGRSTKKGLHCGAVAETCRFSTSWSPFQFAQLGVLPPQNAGTKS